MNRRNAKSEIPKSAGGRGSAWSWSLWGRGSAARLPFFVFPFSFILLLSGCGVPGEPQPRRPAVAAAVNDLEVRQRGEAVELRFTLPQRTTAGRPIEEALTLEVYRWFERANVAPDPARAPDRAHAVVGGEQLEKHRRNGFVELADRFPPRQLAERAGQQAVYLVRTALRGRLSARSNLAAVRVWPAPAPPQVLECEVTQQAIELRWQSTARTTDGSPLAAPAGYRVYRAETPAALGPLEEFSFRLVATTSEPLWRDTDFVFGREYTYAVTAVADFESDTRESAYSTLAPVRPVDVFPPAPPESLVAIFVPAAAGRPAAVELSWSLGEETDLAGYHVYRSERADAPGERLTRELLLAPTFRDTQVPPGRRYFYSVAAVDRAGNSSAPGAAIAVEVPAP